MTDINDVLEKRGNNYGAFESHADITQTLKSVVKESSGWRQMEPMEREALEMILHKIGRICNGNPHFGDSWLDISGYATLVVQILEEQGR